MKETLVEASGLCLGFQDLVLLQPANFLIFSGEIVILLGLQDSGRQALFRYLCGNQEALSGSVQILRKPVHVKAPWAGAGNTMYVSRLPSMSLGFLTVTEYLFLVRKEKRRNILWNEARREDCAETLLSQVGLDIKPSVRLDRLSRVEKRLVDFTKAMDCGARLILMEEDFEGYTPNDMETLFLAMQHLKEQGNSFLLDTNALKDIGHLADRMFLFRNRSIVKKIWNKNFDPAAIDGYLYETPRESSIPVNAAHSGSLPAIRYKISGIPLGNGGFFSLSVYSGEAVNILVYDIQQKNRLFNLISGRSTGTDQKHPPLIWLDNRMLFPHEQRQPVSRHIVSIRNLGSADELFVNMSPVENLLLPSMKKISRFGIFVSGSVKKALERLYLRDISKEHEGVEALNDHARISLTLERWRIYGCKVLVLLEPFLHLDQQGRELAARYFLQMKEAGVAIIIISSSINTYGAICERLIRIEETQYPAGEGTR
ncbi:hypothetical protein FACS1894130_02290 [Spirochaetia bacterium]|nr:hypothetical protein FACS1894130_02290 [Spirochaetia bacterium]